MNIVDILNLMYPGEIAAGNIAFYQPEQEILIYAWNVEGVPQPTEAEVMAEEPTYQWQFDFNNLVSGGELAVAALLDSTAKARSYGDALSCVSYANSTNPSWHAEGTTFSEWRDAVWDYLYTQYAKYSTPGTPLPTLDEIMAGVPAIVWPV